VQATCESSASNAAIASEIEKLVAPTRYKATIRAWCNIGVGIYLDQLPTNRRGPNDPPPNIVKGWAAPDPEQWKSEMFVASGAAAAATGAACAAAAALAAALALL
jgi:hypothetical protein